MRRLSVTIDNPVAIRELRMRMRGGRAHLVMFAYVLIVCLVVFLGYLLSFSASMGSGGRIDPVLGQVLFYALYGFQVALITLAVPGLTAWLISAEREQQTIELLVSTLLTSRNIVAGKLLPAIGFLALLLITSLPAATLCLVFGGLTPFAVFSGYVALFMHGCVLAAIGILCSSLFQRSFAATICAYILAVAYMFGPFFFAPLMAMAGMSVFSGSSSSWIGASLMPSWVTAMLVMDTYSSASGGTVLTMVALSTFLNGLLALLLATVATANIPHQRTDRAPQVRGVFVAYTCSMAAAILWTTYGPGLIPKMSMGELALWFGILASLAVTMAPQFAAAPLDPAASGVFDALRRSLNPRRWLSTEGAGGFWFVLAWTVLVAAILVGTTSLRATYPAQFLPATIGLLGVTLAMTAASGSFGICCYALTGQVVLSRAITFLTIAVLWAVSSGVWSALGGVFGYPGLASSPAAWIRYVWPYAPFFEWGSIKSSTQSASALSLASTCIHLALAAAFLLVSNAAWMKRRRMAAAPPAPIFAPPPAEVRE